MYPQCNYGLSPTLLQCFPRTDRNFHSPRYPTKLPFLQVSCCFSGLLPEQGKALLSVPFDASFALGRRSSQSFLMPTLTPWPLTFVRRLSLSFLCPPISPRPQPHPLAFCIPFPRFAGRQGARSASFRVLNKSTRAIVAIRTPRGLFFLSRPIQRPGDT